jgi:hypothetical protein
MRYTPHQRNQRDNQSRNANAMIGTLSPQTPCVYNKVQFTKPTIKVRGENTEFTCGRPNVAMVVVQRGDNQSALKFAYFDSDVHLTACKYRMISTAAWQIEFTMATSTANKTGCSVMNDGENSAVRMIAIAVTITGIHLVNMGISFLPPYMMADDATCVVNVTW